PLQRLGLRADPQGERLRRGEGPGCARPRSAVRPAGPRPGVVRCRVDRPVAGRRLLPLAPCDRGRPPQSGPVLAKLAGDGGAGCRDGRRPGEPRHPPGSVRPPGGPPVAALPADRSVPPPAVPRGCPRPCGGEALEPELPDRPPLRPGVPAPRPPAT